MPDPWPAWLPIETAPKDGTRVLLTGWWEDDPTSGHRWTCDGFWDDLTEEWFEHPDRVPTDGALVPPTHWLPLPPPPEGA